MRRHFWVATCLVAAWVIPASASRVDSVASNYVVIGVFSVHENAQRFVKDASTQLQLEATYEKNMGRNLYYVYVLKTNDLNQALVRAREVREKPAFRDAWVFNGVLGANPAGVKGRDIYPPLVKAVPKPTAPPAEKTDAPAPTLANTVKALEPSGGQEAAVPVQTESPAAVSAPSATPAASAAVATPSVEVDPNAPKYFMFTISTKGGEKILDGEVDIFDVETDKRKASYKGHQQVRIERINKSGKMSIVCEVFGYRRMVQIVDFNEPTATPGVTEQDGVVQVPFELVRLKKGDIQVMYQVYFFKDAAIMRPESRYEVNALKEMLQENPAMAVRIHGHTNGNASGKIIEAAESSYFSLANSKDSYGTAKKLSEERAMIIRAYLVSEGIDATRMQIKAWGGKKPVVDKLHSQAESNVRVEVEVLSD